MPSHLVIGGRRSGKSAYAEQWAIDQGKPLTYIATSRAYDTDHQKRINAHRARRQGQGWAVIEVLDPLKLQTVLDTSSGAVLVDCLSMWLNNLFLEKAPVPSLTIPSHVILVSLEVGLGVHPETKLGRNYADALGRLNQIVAAQVDRVSFITAGLPLILKG